MSHTNGRGRPALMSAADLLEMELPEPRWAIDGLLPEGLVVLAGKPKCGKSWLVLLWATLVAAGEPFGAFPASAGNVLYLALEDNCRRLRSRLDKLKSAGPAGLMLATECAGRVAGLREWLSANPSVRLVVIDTLARLGTGRGPRPGQSAYAADYETLVPLKGLADEFGVCVLVVTHTRKAKADDVFDTVTGTRGVTGAADAMIVLTRTGCGGRLFLTGRDVESRIVHLTWDKNRCRWEPLGGRGDAPLSSERLAVLKAVHEAGRPLAPKEVAEATRANEGATRKLLREMVAAEQLEEADGHRYAVPSG